METAVKIPDLEDDQNQQPFVTDFDFSGTKMVPTAAYIIGLDWNRLVMKGLVCHLVFSFLRTERIRYFIMTMPLKNKGMQAFLQCH